MRNFRLFAGANILAMTATWMQRIAQDWLVLQLTGSVADVGVTVAMQFGPMLVLGLYGGVIVDRYSKRKLLMITQSTVGVLSAVIAILALTGTATVWAVWATALGVGLATVVDNPARQVFVNELVGPTHLRNAITINSGVFQLGGLIGPAVSGALIARHRRRLRLRGQRARLRRDRLHAHPPRPERAHPHHAGAARARAS